MIQKMIKKLSNQQDLQLSIIVVIFNMHREAPRTLFTLSSIYQNINDSLYEVIIVDNGSSRRLSEELIKDYGKNFHYYYVNNAHPSPVFAINYGVEKSCGDIIGVMIDGARMLTPNIIDYTLRAFKAYDNPVVSTLAWHLGPDLQNKSIMNGYNQEKEDTLLESVNWKKDGYTLFTISSFAGSSARGWFLPIGESNCLFVKREDYEKLNGFDERFNLPGGGLANLDFYKRACELEHTELIILLSEGTFHQIHGGTATNSSPEQHTIETKKYKKQYHDIVREAFSPPLKQPIYLGKINRLTIPFLKDSFEKFLSVPSDRGYKYE